MTNKILEIYKDDFENKNYYNFVSAYWRLDFMITMFRDTKSFTTTDLVKRLAQDKQDYEDAFRLLGFDVREWNIPNPFTWKSAKNLAMLPEQQYLVIYENRYHIATWQQKFNKFHTKCIGFFPDAPDGFLDIRVRDIEIGVGNIELTSINRWATDNVRF